MSEKGVFEERREFETLFAKTYLGGMELGRNSADEYVSPYTQTAWDAWQASQTQHIEEVKSWID